MILTFDDEPHRCDARQERRKLHAQASAYGYARPGKTPLDHPLWDPYRFTLTQQEHALALALARLRHDHAVRDGKPDSHGFGGDDGRIHQVGALGEMAVAKYLDVPWDQTLDTYKKGFDQSYLQVRTRSTEYYGDSPSDLIIRNNDHQNHCFVLVVMTLPLDLRIVGWTWAGDVRWRLQENHGGREWSWFTPQRELRPMKDLPSLRARIARTHR
jgi:hypothetical protein